MGGNSQLPERGSFVRVGRVAKPHGIRGELKVIPHGVASDFDHYPEVLLGSEAEPAGRLYRIGKRRSQGTALLLELDGVTDRAGAEALVGREVWVERRYLPPLAEDEFYWHEIIGLKVLVEGRGELGRVAAIMPTPGHDLLVVRGGGREHLIPARREFMLDTDLAAGVLTIADLPGLFDLND